MLNGTQSDDKLINSFKEDTIDKANLLNIVKESLRMLPQVYSRSWDHTQNMKYNSVWSGSLLSSVNKLMEENTKEELFNRSDFLERY